MAKESGTKTKAKRPTPQKRDIQSEKRRLRNKSMKSNVRTSIRALDDSLPKGDQAVIQQKLNEIYSVLDKAAKQGVFKQNKSDRLKARLAARAAKAKDKA